MTAIRVDSVKDETPAAQDASPLAAEREWQQQAEDNVVDRLQRAGLLAPEGDVDKILMTVVNNLLITNNIELPRPVRTRVLLTSPLETFSVGNTIVVSRGLIDTLPDEVKPGNGSFAMNLRISCSDTTSAASMPSTTECSSLTRERTRTLASSTFRKRKQPPTRKRWSS